MARSRNIKPAFFKNEALAEVGCDTRLLFIGLWTLADREGRAEDRPKRIRAEIFPFDGFDVESMLTELQRLGFLTRYEVDGNKYIQITNFVKHQDPHYREKASEIPPMCGSSNEIIATGVTRTQRARILERDNFKCQHCGSLEHPCIDHVLPVSRGGDSSDDNLQVLCLPCNTKKGNKLDSSSSQRRVDVKSSDSPSVPLIPDSLNLIPDSPKKTSRTAFALPDWIDKDNWDLWMKTRKGKKMIPEQMQAQVKKLEKWKDEGLDHRGALFNSASNGYSGLFLPDSRKQSNGNSVQEARLSVAHQIMGGVNGTKRPIVDINQRPAIENYGESFSETSAGVWESDASKVAGH